MPFEELRKVNVTKNDIDAHEIVEGLWQGSKPPEGFELKQLGFDMLVLCAEEWQHTELYDGIEVVLAPNDDDPSRPPTAKELEIALSAARRVAQAHREGKAVLVTCWQGWNRSGLVSALSLHLLTGASGEACILMVRNARPSALCNPQFRKSLTKLKKIRDVQPRTDSALQAGKTGTRS